MTLREFMVYYEQQMKHKRDELKIHERFSARICAMLANINRDTKKRSRPYKEDEFMSGYKKKPLTPEQFAEMLKAVTVAHGGEVKVG